MVLAKRFYVLSGFALLAGCFSPDDVSAGTESETDTDTAPTSTSTASTTAGTMSTTAGTMSTTAETDPTTTSSPPTSTEPTTDETTDATTDPPTGDETTTGGPPACGDGSTDDGEECDDGDIESGDGCSAACLDESNFCDPRLIGALGGNSTINRIAVSGDVLFARMLGGNARIESVDVSDPETPSMISSFAPDPDDYPNWDPLDILVEGTHLWTSGNNPEFISVDVSDPANMTLDFIAGPNFSDGHIAILGDRLYEAHSVGEQLRGWNISDPSGPSGLPSIGNPSRVFDDVAGFGDRVIALNGAQLEIWDVSVPGVPAFEGDLVGGGWGGSRRSVANDDTVAIAAGVNPEVTLVDYSNPNAPAVAGSLDEDGAVGDLGIRDDFLYVPITNGLRVYDISNPDDPVQAGSYLEIEVYGTGIGLGDDYVFLGTESGLRILADMPGFCEARCGNSTVEYPEECDDGNLLGGDGCSTACVDE